MLRNQKEKTWDQAQDDLERSRQKIQSVLKSAKERYGKGK